MRPSSANIRSPEVLRRFKHRYLEFDKRIHGALDLVLGDARSVGDWLLREQLPHWRQQLRRRHDHMKQMWREYYNARYGDRRMGKPSCVDERKAYERAKRMKAEAELKLEVIQGWMNALDREIEKLIAPVKRLEMIIDATTPKAVLRLDHMMDRLDDYLRPSSAGSPPPTPPASGQKGGPDAQV